MTMLLNLFIRCQDAIGTGLLTFQLKDCQQPRSCVTLFSSKGVFNIS
ncbi:hypothetical protein SDC9_04270 [bioreactor metagenome]|uniref:Uncharacterized protein n=1 Tax=bioreactor metagenome TaxID=1076179 RepID=A0A644SVJ9_9ZZZZ